MRSLVWLMSAIPLALGCGSGGGGGGGSVVAPNDGQWEIGLFVLDHDCSNLLVTDSGDTATETVDLTMDGDGNGLTILGEDGSLVHFTLSATNFVADDMPSPGPTSFAAEGINATFYVDISLSVEFSSQTQGTMATQTDASCVGADPSGVAFCETTDFPGWGFVPCTAINEAPMSAL